LNGPCCPLLLFHARGTCPNGPSSLLVGLARMDHAVQISSLPTRRSPAASMVWLTSAGSAAVDSAFFFALHLCSACNPQQGPPATEESRRTSSSCSRLHSCRTRAVHPTPGEGCLWNQDMVFWPLPQDLERTDCLVEVSPAMAQHMEGRAISQLNNSWVVSGCIEQLSAAEGAAHGRYLVVSHGP
jgi:hypothetical protein